MRPENPAAYLNLEGMFGSCGSAGASARLWAMKHFVLIYEFVPDYMERRVAFRGEHLTLARASAERDELQLGGALVEEPTGLLLFKAETPAVAEAFAASDPYVRNGVVRSYRIRQWTTVVGSSALTQVGS